MTDFAMQLHESLCQVAYSVQAFGRRKGSFLVDEQDYEKVRAIKWRKRELAEDQGQVHQGRSGNGPAWPRQQGNKRPLLHHYVEDESDLKDRAELIGRFMGKVVGPVQ